ncbi:MAG TPA: AAA domain-containing protein, partial [Actinomycetes bacterium]|nr:AAA domain-containing protein [Actinomycetes bacterium]
RVSDASRLAELLDLLAERPAGLPNSWLSGPDLDEIHSTVHRLTGDLDATATAEQAATSAAGIPWQRLPDPTAIPDQEQESNPRPPLETDELTPERAVELSEMFAADADRLDARIKSLRGVTSMLGLLPAVTVSDARETLTVAEIAVKRDRPERAWLTPDGLTAAKAAVAVIRDAAGQLAAAQAAARAYFNDAALSADVTELAARFGRIHHGINKLRAGYRADKRSVAAITAAQVAVEASIAHLGLAVEWQRAVADQEAVAASQAGALGAYHTGPTTDLARVDGVLADAAVAVRRAAGGVIGGDSVLADCLAADRDSPPPPALADLISGTRRDLEEWISRLAPEPVPAAPVELARRPLDEVVTWLRDQAAALRLAADRARRLGDAVGRPLTLGEAAIILVAQAAVHSAHATLASRAEDYTRVCGELYRGPATDSAAVSGAVAWTERARTLGTGMDTPFTLAQVEALGAATATPLLADAAGGWQRVAQALLDGFEPSRRADLVRELDDYTDAADLIAALRADLRGRDEWLAHVAARSALGARGLTVAIDFCESERLPAGQIPQVITKAVLQEWADYHLTRDPALQPARTTDRDEITMEFRELDRTLVASAVSKIITVVNGRRPRNDIGQSALIQREASKKRKHMPVRRLIDRTMHVVQAVKPCFMMSPLSVSQYLPADMTFDVVIFDEASQLMPGDAINCIYRGRSLITAGDQKQLPPTTFFTPTTEDPTEEWTEENESTKDFESIMDLVKAAGVFKSLPLRWHYRSRHEGLIAFSNTSFYNGSLVTFPGAEHRGQDVGVELFQVDGVYRRGSTRDNPIEAEKVADRVIHHFDTRPEMSLGVVTFSEPQAAAVEWAVELARLERPDLDRYFTDDRLDGFFVKNLESVQGDERDVMIFSVGYGPDEKRKITMNFGPVNRPGGWRRLNVAITRARYRVEIVSSITAADITEHSGSEGVRQLRRYLDYAARGVSALELDDGAEPAERDVGSPFEQSVIAAIRSWGYEAVPRVGAAGYRIDIGVVHPELPGVYALGVECDGPAYHSARAARDRDRLRDQVLRGLGWRLHRVWGTAWHRDRHAEEAHLRAAIEAAVRAPDPAPGVDGPPDSIQRPAVSIEPVTLERFGHWAVPYRVAEVDPLPAWVDVSDVGAHHEMRSGIRTIVSVESPLHVTVLRQRLR